MADHDRPDYGALPPPPSSASPAPPPESWDRLETPWDALSAVHPDPASSKRGGILKAVLGLLVAAALGVAAFFLFFRDDNGDADPAPVQTTAVENDTDVADDLGEPADTTQPAGVDPETVVALQLRITELEEALADAADPAELESVRAELAEAVARAEAAEALAETEPGAAVIGPAAAIEQSLPAAYRVTWGDALVCTGLDSCAGVEGPTAEFYVDVDVDTGNFRMVAPGIVLVPLEQQGLNLEGSGPLVDSGWVCPTDDVMAGGVMTVVLFPSAITAAGDTGAITVLAGSVQMLLDESTACPPLYFEWSITAERIN